MSRFSTRSRRSGPVPRLGSALSAAAVLCCAGPAFAQSDDDPPIPDGLAAPSDEEFRRSAPPLRERVREDGIDARRFQPVPSAPGVDPGDAYRRDPGGTPLDPRRGSNGYQYQSPSTQPQAPLLPDGRSPNSGSLNDGYQNGGYPGASDLRLAPGYPGRPGGFDPDDSPVVLGVSGTDTASGVLITRVIPGTPADRAGLERGDRVLAVGGQQVGLVSTTAGPRVVPLGAELARHIGPTGDAVLLVQDHRTRIVTTVTVRPVPRYGPTSPPGYGPGYGSGYGPDYPAQYGPETGFGTGVRPLDPNRWDPYDRSRLPRR